MNLFVESSKSQDSKVDIDDDCTAKLHTTVREGAVVMSKQLKSSEKVFRHWQSQENQLKSCTS